VFTQWLLTQQDMPGATGRAARLAWAEMNNGVVSREEKGLFWWREHFNRRLGPEKGDVVFKDFIEAYFEFKSIEE
jgi:hypothetical protein